MRPNFAVIVRYTAAALCLLMMGNAVSFADHTTLDASVAKQKVEKHGIGQRTRITEKTGVTLDGTILSIDANTFQLQPKSGAPVVVSYSEVATVRGAGLSKTAKWAIGIGIGLGATAGISAAVFDHEFHAHPI